MLTRQPLNGLQPRTEREAARDPWDWWEAPAPKPRATRYAERCEQAIAVLAVLVLIAIALRLL